MAGGKVPSKLTEADFQRLFREVRADIDDLQLNDRVLIGAAENLTRYPRLGQNFPAFFTAFYAAMRTDLIIRLGRIYDPEGTGRQSCTLARCLSTLRDSPEFFTAAAITARLNEDYRRANPNYLHFHRPDPQQIEKDLDTLASSRKRLINLRHKLYAHKDLQTVLSAKSGDLLSTHDEVKGLILLAHEISNHYSRIWNASTWSDKPLGGGDDYKWLFTCLRRGLKVRSVLDNRQFDRLRKRATTRQGGKR